MRPLSRAELWVVVEVEEEVVELEVLVEVELEVD